MAIRKNNVLGQTSGKLGNTVTRIRYGKEVVYALPDKVKVSQSEQAKAARNKFAMTVNFAKFINSIPALSRVWSSANIPGTNSYQKLIKHNSKLTGENFLTTNNIITPNTFNIKLVDFTYNENIISFRINYPDINSLFPLQTFEVLYFFDPKQKDGNQFLFNNLSQEINLISSDYKIEIPLTGNSIKQNLSSHFNKCIMFVAALSNDVIKSNVVWSNTIAYPINAF